MAIHVKRDSVLNRGLGLGPHNFRINCLLNLYLLREVHMCLDITNLFCELPAVIRIETTWPWIWQKYLLHMTRAHVEVLLAQKLSKIQCFWIQILKIWVKSTQGSNSEFCTWLQSEKLVGQRLHKFQRDTFIAKRPQNGPYKMFLPNHEGDASGSCYSSQM